MARFTPRPAKGARALPHAVSLITTLAAGFGLALLLGFVAARLGLPALVGYLVAGIAIGPATPGFVADGAIASQLAEIGVMLLMFGVGLHFSFEDLLAVRRIALPGALVQMTFASALGTGVGLLWGWPLGEALVFGISLSVASTVVLLKALESLGELETASGRIAVGWLVVEDLAMVLVLVLLPALAPSLGGTASESRYGTGVTILVTLAQVGAFVAFMLIVGRRLFPWVLWQVAKTGSRELFTLCVVAAAVSIAYGSSALFGVSFALGAFFAGMVLRESEFSARAAEQTLPLQDAFAVLFFVSVGMVFEPKVLVEEPLRVLATVAVIIVGKALVAIGLVLSLRYPPRTALVVAAGLAQVGEFSFILASLGLALGLLKADGHSLILAGALISIALNPLLFAATRPIEAWLQRRPRLAAHTEPAANPLAELPMDTASRYLANQVVLVGWGRVGKHVAQQLAGQGVPYVVLESNREFVEMLRAQGQPAVWGDATEPEALVQAHVKEARALVIATPVTLEVRAMSATARELNPAIAVAIRCHSAEEAELLEQDGAGTAFVGETELAHAMTRFVLGRVTGLAGDDTGLGTPSRPIAAPDRGLGSGLQA
jgi:CPA2 family monovalent cation:H+ antiporter-2